MRKVLAVTMAVLALSAVPAMAQGKIEISGLVGSDVLRRRDRVCGQGP